MDQVNEPHGALDARAWNALLAKLLQVVRKTNPTRNVVVGPTRWNNLEELDTLRLPEDDRHLVVTFHYYEPFAFTHQGASWVEPQFSEKTGVRFTPEQVAKIESDFDKVEAWSRRHGRPILLGEYGAYDKAPMEDRVLWTRTVARAAEKRGFAHLYWQFSSDFVLYDFQREDWVEPLLHAVVPPKPATCTASRPSLRLTQIACGPPRLELKAMRCPSGDHAGLESQRVLRRNGPASTGLRLSRSTRRSCERCAQCSNTIASTPAAVAGCCTTSLPSASWRRSLPSGAADHSAYMPERVEVNSRRRPSGDQATPLSLRLSKVRRVAAPPSRPVRYRSRVTSLVARTNTR